MDRSAKIRFSYHWAWRGYAAQATAIPAPQVYGVERPRAPEFERGERAVSLMTPARVRFAGKLMDVGLWPAPWSVLSPSSRFRGGENNENTMQGKHAPQEEVDMSQI